MAKVYGNTVGVGGSSLQNIPTDEKYFEIDIDGLISLKPEYRGSVSEAYANGFPYCKSDNGVGLEGSQISELPERIVIPQNINGEEVTGFQKGMFCCNHKVKEVVFPSNSKEIPNGMFREAKNLEKIENTDCIENIGIAAFMKTKVKEGRFPSLLTLGSGAFAYCTNLILIDIGNIETITDSAFQACENLSEVLGGSKVTQIGVYTFTATRRLKNLPFLSNVKSVGQYAFFSSRCDFEEDYDTMVGNGCTFGANATYKQFNTTDYWSNVTFTPCRNPLNSLFHQKDIRWADKVIATYDDGVPLTYGNNGCALVVLAEIYSAFNNVTFESPEEFWLILEDKGLTHLNFKYTEQWCQIANRLGFQTDYISEVSQAALTRIYNGLSQGALIFRSSASTSVDGGHAMLGYGINSKGEMLTSDPSPYCSELGIYENQKTAWHIYKHGSQKCDVVIVTKT